MNSVRMLLRRVRRLVGFGGPRPPSSKRDETTTALTEQQPAWKGAPADGPPLTPVESAWKGAPADGPPLTPVESEYKARPGEAPPLMVSESAYKAGPADLPPLTPDISAFEDRAGAPRLRNEEVEENLPATDREPE